MKADLATSVIAVVAGIVIAYFVTNIFTPSLENVSFKVLDESVDSALASPDEEIFNYRSVNPTVEVYVGECKTFNEEGKCIDDEFESEGTYGDSD